MRTRLLLKLLPGLLLAALLAGTALAGGVVVTLDGEVGAVTPNTPFDVSFTIRSAHDQSLQTDLTPTVTAANAATGETLTFTGAALADPGRYQATVTLPAGTWNWSIVPFSDYPKEMIATLPPLQVAAPAAAAPVTLSPALLWAGLPLAAVLLGALLVAGRRRRTALAA